MSEHARHPLPPDASAGLKRRYEAHRATEGALATYLEAVVAVLGIDPASVRGFDDATGELLLEDDDA